MYTRRTRVAAAALVIVGAAGSWTASGASALSGAGPVRAHATAARNGRIFFSTGFVLPNPDLSGNWQVYAVRPDGSHLTQLTHVGTGFAAGDPSVSPDGRQVSYVSDVSGAFAVWMMRADGTHQHQVLATKGFDYFTPGWSPNGRRLVVSACNTSVGYDGWCDLVTVHADGSHRHVLVSELRYDSSPQYSPSGRWIEFSSDRRGDTGAIWLIRTDGRHAHRVTPPRLEAYSGAWSPDGRHIVFGSNCCQADGNLYSITPSGRHLRQLTRAPFPHSVGFPSYSPDGRYIAFISDMRRPVGSPKIDLFVMRADGTHIRRIETKDQPPVFSSWGTSPKHTRTEGQAR